MSSRKFILPEEKISYTPKYNLIFLKASSMILVDKLTNRAGKMTKKILTSILTILIGSLSSCGTFQLKSSLFSARNMIVQEGGTRNLQKAEKILLKLQLEDPNNPEVHNLLGIFYYKTHQWEEAKNEFEQAIDLGINSYEPYFYKGLIYYRNGEYDFARRDLEKAASVADSNNQCIPEIFKVMASIFEIMEKYYGAIAFYKQALSCPMPNKSEIERNAFKAEINERLGLIAERLAKIAWGRGNYDDSNNQASLAENYYLKAIQLDPDEPVYYYNLAQLYLWLGRINDAIRYYKLAAKKANMTGELTVQKEAYYSLGMIYDNIGEKINNTSLIKLAISMFSSVESISPDYKHVRCTLGKLYWLLGEKNNAYNTLSQCCQADMYGYETNNNNHICGEVFVQLKKAIENKIALTPLQTPQNEFEQPKIQTETIGGEVEASVTTTEMKPQNNTTIALNQPSSSTNQLQSSQNTATNMASSSTSQKSQSTQEGEQVINHKSKASETTQIPPPPKTPTTEITPSENKVQKKKIEPSKPTEIAMVSHQPPAKLPHPESNTSLKQPQKQKHKKTNSVQTTTPIMSDIDASIGDLDQILANQGNSVRSENIIIAGVRRRGNVQSVDVNLDVGSGKNLLLKNKIRKIKNQLKITTKKESGHLAPEVISRVIASHYGEVRYCYEKQLKMNPDLEGKLTVRFTIGTDGHISNATIEESTLNNMEVESCVLYKVKNWQFPRPRGGSVTVIFPFIFMGS